jgi:hypothetical protein
MTNDCPLRMFGVVNSKMSCVDSPALSPERPGSGSSTVGNPLSVAEVSGPPVISPPPTFLMVMNTWLTTLGAIDALTACNDGEPPGPVPGGGGGGVMRLWWTKKVMLLEYIRAPGL